MTGMDFILNRVLSDAALVDALVLREEGENLDFKEKWYSSNANQEFAKDVAAMHNSAVMPDDHAPGIAFIVVGVRDGSKEIVGMQPAADLLPWEQMLHDYLHPHPRYFFHYSIKNGKKLMIVAIVKGLTPCRVKKSMRSSDGKLHLKGEVFFRRGSCTSKASIHDFHWEGTLNQAGNFAIKQGLRSTATEAASVLEDYLRTLPGLAHVDFSRHMSVDDVDHVFVLVTFGGGCDVDARCAPSDVAWDALLSRVPFRCVVSIAKDGKCHPNDRPYLAAEEKSALFSSWAVRAGRARAVIQHSPPPESKARWIIVTPTALSGVDLALSEYLKKLQLERPGRPFVFVVVADEIGSGSTELLLKQVVSQFRDVANGYESGLVVLCHEYCPEDSLAAAFVGNASAAYGEPLCVSSIADVFGTFPVQRDQPSHSDFVVGSARGGFIVPASMLSVLEQDNIEVVARSPVLPSARASTREPALATDAEKEAAAREFVYGGRDLPFGLAEWRGLHRRHDVVCSNLRCSIDDFLRGAPADVSQYRRNFVSLVSDPYAGSTTVGRQLLASFASTHPCFFAIQAPSDDSLGMIRSIANSANSRALLVIDGPLSSNVKKNVLACDSIVLLHVCRSRDNAQAGSIGMTSTGKQFARFHLSSLLNDSASEKERLLRWYESAAGVCLSKEATSSSADLSHLALHAIEALLCPTHRSLPRLISGHMARLAALSPTTARAMAYLALLSLVHPDGSPSVNLATLSERSPPISIATFGEASALLRRKGSNSYCVIHGVIAQGILSLFCSDAFNNGSTGDNDVALRNQWLVGFEQTATEPWPPLRRIALENLTIDLFKVLLRATKTMTALEIEDSLLRRMFFQSSTSRDSDLCKSIELIKAPILFRKLLDQASFPRVFEKMSAAIPLEHDGPMLDARINCLQLGQHLGCCDPAALWVIVDEIDNGNAMPVLRHYHQLGVVALSGMDSATEGDGARRVAFAKKCVEQCRKGDAKNHAYADRLEALICKFE